MDRMRNPKIGLAGVMCTPFRGDKEGSYRTHRAQLEDLAAAYGFEFFAVEEGVYNVEQAKAAAQKLEDWGADFILLQTSSFAAGDFVYPFTELDAYLGLWALEEGPPTGPPVNVEIIGEDPDVLKALSDDAIRILENSDVFPKLVGLESDLDAARSELQIAVDREKAGLYGLTTFGIANTVRGAVQGIEAAGR